LQSVTAKEALIDAGRVASDSGQFDGGQVDESPVADENFWLAPAAPALKSKKSTAEQPRVKK
jgi:hypothetical protein